MSPEVVNLFRKKAIEKTILRILRRSAFSHSLEPTADIGYSAIIPAVVSG
jgi:hypothetical protein